MKVVVDANLLVALVLPTAYSAAASRKMHQWNAEDADLFSPALWSYEAVSTVRKYVAHKMIDAQDAVASVNRLLALDVLDVQPTASLHRRALRWADRLHVHVAYDAAYLAVAESLEGMLWTADLRLVKNARSLGIDWVHAVQDSTIS